MPSNFTLTLDTVAPAGASLVLNSGDAVTTTAVVNALLDTSDGTKTGYQIKIWGDVDPAANANIQATEGTSQWITPGSWPANQAVTLSAGDGSKTINAKIRDDVWNETAVLADTITLDTSIPTANITVGPDATRVSTVAGKRTVNFSFQSDVAADAWKVKVVPATNSTESQGTQIGVTNGSTGVTGGVLAAATNQSVSLDARDIQAASAGDGDKIIKIFVREVGTGLWSA